MNEVNMKKMQSLLCFCRYEFDPDRYEGDETESETTTTTGGQQATGATTEDKTTKSDGSTGTVIPTLKQDDLDLQIDKETTIIPAISTPSPTPSADRSKLKSLDLTPVTPEAPKKKEKLPPRPADYDYYWYQDEDGSWRNEYDDQGYEFADDEYDLEEAEEITKQQSEDDRVKAEAERGSSLTGLETIPEQYDEYGQLILSDAQYRKHLARERWHWAFTKIVQVRTQKKLSSFDPCFSNFFCVGLTQAHTIFNDSLLCSCPRAQQK